MAETKIWILVAVCGITFTALGFLIKVITDTVLKRLDMIIEQLRKLNDTTIVQGEEIKYLKEHHVTTNHRLNSHAERIKTIEIKLGV